MKKSTDGLFSHPVKAAARFALGLVILAFLGIVLARNWERLAEDGVRVQWLFFALAVFWNLVFFILQALVWRQALSFMGHPLPATQAGAIWAASQVSKYVPGKVMLILVRMGLCRRRGVPGTQTLISIALELTLMVVTATLACLLLAPSAFSALAPEGGIPPALFLIPVLCGLIGLHPKILGPVLSLAFRLLKRDPISLDIPYRHILVLGAICCLGWLAHGLSALASVRALGVQATASLATFTGLFAFGWLVGFLSFLTPGGLGVREGALAAALTLIYPLEIGIAIALLSRLAWIAAEALLAGATWPFRPRVKEEA